MTTEHDMAVAMATEIGKQVPVKQVYDDAASPAARQVGATLEDVVKCIRLVGFPIQWFAVQQDRFRAFIEKAKESIPEERRILPAPQLLGPILEGIRYEIEDSPISDLFQNLLSSSMDAEKVNFVHPSFISIVRSLSPDEAKILQFLVRDYIRRIKLGSGILSDDSLTEVFVVDDLRLDFPENADFYMDRLFTLGLLDWERQIRSEKTFLARQPMLLKLSRSGERLMTACGLMP